MFLGAKFIISKNISILKIFFVHLYIKYANRHYIHSLQLTFMTHFDTAAELIDRVNKYFTTIAGEKLSKEDPDLKDGEKQTQPDGNFFSAKPGDPALLTGLALSLGFASLADFEAYEQSGRHKKILQRARLRVEMQYELRLHQPAPTGAQFALRCMGWSEKQRIAKKPLTGKITPPKQTSAIPLPKSEKEVIL